jgi:hypothetical protein
MTFGPERTAQRKPSTVDTSIACGGAGNFGGIDGRDHPRTGPAKAGNLGGINHRARPRTGPAKEAPAACTFEGREDRCSRQLTATLRAHAPGSGRGKGHAAAW